MKMGILLISALVLWTGVPGASAGTLQFELNNSEIEKFQFFAAIEATRNGLTQEERQLIVSSDAYENGDVYYLTGNLTDEWTNNEWDSYYGIAKWLVQAHFRVIMNPFSSELEVREAVQNPRVTAIIWSSHGDQEGQIFDANKTVLPRDVFSSGVSPNLRQIILSNCYGEATVKYYSMPKNVYIKHWTGITNSKELFDYLVSDSWNKDLGLVEI